MNDDAMNKTSCVQRCQERAADRRRGDAHHYAVQDHTKLFETRLGLITAFLDHQFGRARTRLSGTSGDDDSSTSGASAGSLWTQLVC